MVLNPPNPVEMVFARMTQSARATVAGELHQLQFHAMSTECRVHVHDASPAVIRDFQSEVVRWVAGFEARYSRFIPNSLIGRINAAAGQSWIQTDDETDRLFALCQDLVFYTRGAFDPTALPLIQLWNWKNQRPQLPSDAVIQAARELVGWGRVQRRPGGVFLPRAGMSLDLGGIGKEYAVDCVMNLARERGIPNVMVDFGQDVRVCGHAPDKPCWWIGLEDAQQPGQCWTGVAVTDHAVATSGDYSRRFELNGRRFGHIIDPRTGYPVENGCRAVSVIAPSCTVAGILSTTAFILGPKDGVQLIETYPAAAGSITTDNVRIHTKRFYEYAAAEK